MHQRAVYALSARVGPPRVRHPPSGRIPMVSNPDVGGHVIEAVEANHIFGVTYYFEDQEIPAMTQHEGICPSVFSIELDV